MSAYKGEEGATCRSIVVLVPASNILASIPSSKSHLTYNGLSEGSQPSNAKLQYAHVAKSSDSGVGVYFQPASTIYVN